MDGKHPERTGGIRARRERAVRLYGWWAVAVTALAASVGVGLAVGVPLTTGAMAVGLLLVSAFGGMLVVRAAFSPRARDYPRSHRP